MKSLNESENALKAAKVHFPKLDINLFKWDSNRFVFTYIDENGISNDITEEGLVTKWRRNVD